MTAPRPDLDAPMRRQLARFHAAIAAGMPRVGWKICINDPRTQSRLGIDAPFVGPLNGTRVFTSGDAFLVSPMRDSNKAGIIKLSKTTCARGAQRSQRGLQFRRASARAAQDDASMGGLSRCA
jgi:hypothetical protein